jgi:hypothetical protein
MSGGSLPPGGWKSRGIGIILLGSGMLTRPGTAKDVCVGVGNPDLPHSWFIKIGTGNAK